MRRGDRDPRVRPRALPSLTVCRGCAGEGLALGEAGRTARPAHYDALAAGGSARPSTVDCLDQCGRGDAILVRPAPDRGRSTLPVRRAGITTPETRAALAAWLDAGGPGSADLPGARVPHVMQVVEVRSLFCSSSWSDPSLDKTPSTKLRSAPSHQHTAYDPSHERLKPVGGPTSAASGSASWRTTSLPPSAARSRRWTG